MSRPYRVAVIPTRDRHAMVSELIDALYPQVDEALVIDNRSDPPFLADADRWPVDPAGAWVTVLAHDVDPPNISAMWNIGLRYASTVAFQHGASHCYDVIVLNSDVSVSSGWVEALSSAMRSTPAVLAYPDQFGGSEQILHTRAEPVDLRQRITGYAYMLRGEAGLRLDESMAWWYSDDSLDWEAREQGGALLVPGLAVEHRCPNGSMQERPELEAQAARDRETFIAKWGQAPH
ncbi:glycosyltransferase family 2 protein [Streptomyces malaysiensis]|uniref:Uncharacterized protein n=1 Tax=Streptomyces malaysiensis subsp. samsunensis TaxID=459658 RepID=A0A9X2LY85_STRMQ|nr:hypothetical protein [Streptomyces samsunensis]MCQ8831744.1 hypothetical protein [Streptomyces samsunensis]